MFILLQEAMRIIEMFDLNLEAIDIEAPEYVVVQSNEHNVIDTGLLIAESNQKNEGAVGHCGSQAKNGERHPQASANSAQIEPTAADNTNFQGEFGQTIPTAQTSATAVDVEEGVEVLSTP